jgi:hypothetical protein
MSRQITVTVLPKSFYCFVKFIHSETRNKRGRSFSILSNDTQCRAEVLLTPVMGILDCLDGIVITQVKTSTKIGVRSEVECSLGGS